MYVFNLQTKETTFCVYSARPGDQIIVLRIKYVLRKKIGSSTNRKWYQRVKQTQCVY